ncbi:FecR family protein [Adhaeribacter aquaticus]|uniref:FecR family protein n=1 Tax=Adhaeribacter aquaticus TaxID=299567 RepID=UPI0003F5427D|nr:FecR domain-containing protein [Adhaeribacter aquaticus]
MDIHFWDLAAKQLNSKATPAEAEALERWRSSDPEHEAQYQQQLLLWQATVPAPTGEVNTDISWQKVRNRLAAKEQQNEVKVIPMYSRLMRVAAAVTLLIGMAWLAQYLFFPYMGRQVVSSGDNTMSVLLPDSSQVWLNKSSKLVYSKQFDGETREVILEGEGFFEVKRNPQRPFIILTKRTQTQVLGTSFNLRDIDSEETAELVVATGKVAFASVNGKGKKQVIAGYAAALDKKTDNITEMPIQAENVWAWKTGRLVFKNQMLDQVIQDVARIYGVRIRLQNAGLAKCRFTASFQDAELKEVLEILQASLQLDYQIQDKLTYTLTGKGCM